MVHKEKSQSLDVILTQIASYRNELGLDIQKPTDDTIRFRFTSVNPRKEDQPYSVTLKLSESNEYTSIALYLYIFCVI